MNAATRLTPSVFVVDDDPSLCRALARLLKAEGFMVETHISAQAFLASVTSATEGCLVLDLMLPDVSGLELQDHLLATDLTLPIIFLTGRATIPSSVRALKRGAADFLTKPVDAPTLVAAVRRALAQGAAERVRRLEQAELRRLLMTLTPRETQVLGQVICGRLNKQIAGELGTVEKTIKVHRARVMEKLQARSLAELVLIAAKAGIAGHALEQIGRRDH